MKGTKPTLLYASPLLPQRSGISDYSEILIFGLAEHFEITLLVAEDCIPENARIREHFEIIQYKAGITLGNYDHRLYNFGNNPYFHSYILDVFLRYPDAVILHDYVLYYLAAGYYNDRDRLYEALFTMEGARGVHLYADARKRNKRPAVEQQGIASSLAMNTMVIDNAQRIFVHSDFTKSLIREKNTGVPIQKINMVNMLTDEKAANNYLKIAHSIPDDAFVIASFGYIADTKQNRLIGEAANLYNEDNEQKIYYVMAGEGGVADDLLGQYVIKTGYLDRADYDGAMQRANMIANLRYPTMGETSISVIHAMGMGKPCLVTDYAWFAELSDDAVIKLAHDIKPEQVVDVISALINEPKMLEEKGKTARALIERDYTTDSIASSIYDFLIAKPEERCSE